MSKFWSSMLVLAVALFVAVGSARAADGGKKKDGKKGERPSAKQIFEKLAGDDGELTVAELAKSRRYNGDEAKAKVAIEKMDTGKNGTVNLEEFTAAMKKRHDEHKKSGGEHKKGGGKKAPK